MRISRIGSTLFGMLLTVSIGNIAHGALATTWSLTSSMGTARGDQGHRASLLSDGRVLVSGGYNGTWLASAEIYDPTTGTWSPTDSMSTSRGWHTSTQLSDGRVLVTGGGNGSSIWSTAEIYDPATSTWSPTGSMSTSRAYHTSTLLSDGRVLVTGGLEPPSYLASADIYDPATGIWSATGAMSTGRGSHIATLLSDGRVLVTGGFDGSSYSDSAEIYDPPTGTWSPTDSMSTSRTFHTSTLLPDGRVLVAGGFNGSSDVASAEVFDPAQGAWSLTGSMSIARGSSTATRLPNGRVLVAGGSDGSSYSASAEIYDPATNTWSLTCSMSTARFRHTATLLLDGRVLVNGGYNGSYLASAEIFDSTPLVVTDTTASNPMTISGGDANVSATFTDAPAQTHTCSISWGDGSPDTLGTVSETNGSGTCTGSHSYAVQTVPLVYEVTITVTDDCGGAVSGVTYIVLYDPNGGFVTGGGWFTSPVGAYTANPAFTGKANFGFVSKYQKNATIPTGDTQFQFSVANFRFDSDSYEWLVISGAKARYRGVGKVNGLGSYGFELTAWDGQVSGGGGVDRIRIKIWDRNQGNGVVYDNQMDAADGADPTTALGGGSIVIHKK